MALRVAPNRFDGRPYIPIVVSTIPWLAIVSLLVGALALVIHRRALVAVSVFCLLVQLVWHWGFFVPLDRLPQEASREAVQAAAGSTSDGIARIMTLNTRNGRADPAVIVNLVREEHVEVLALQELNSGFIQALDAAGLGKLLPHRIIAQSTGIDNGGVNGLWTRATPTGATTNLIPIEASAVAAGSIDFAGHVVRFGTVHPFSPRPSNRDLWDKGLDAIAQLSRYDHTYVLMGDFNSSWDHRSFRNLLGNRFVDAGERSGEGFHMTYPADRTIFGIQLPPMVEIDHIVHDRGVTVGDLETQRIPGSDHMALLATLAVR